MDPNQPQESKSNSEPEPEQIQQDGNKNGYKTIPAAVHEDDNNNNQVVVYAVEAHSIDSPPSNNAGNIMYPSAVPNQGQGVTYYTQPIDSPPSNNAGNIMYPYAVPNQGQGVTYYTQPIDSPPSNNAGNIMYPYAVPNQGQGVTYYTQPIDSPPSNNAGNIMYPYAVPNQGQGVTYYTTAPGGQMQMYQYPVQGQGAPYNTPAPGGQIQMVAPNQLNQLNQQQVHPMPMPMMVPNGGPMPQQQEPQPFQLGQPIFTSGVGDTNGWAFYFAIMVLVVCNLAVWGAIGGMIALRMQYEACLEENDDDWSCGSMEYRFLFLLPIVLFTMGANVTYAIQFGAIFFNQPRSLTQVKEMIQQMQAAGPSIFLKVSSQVTSRHGHGRHSNTRHTTIRFEEPFHYSQFLDRTVPPNLDEETADYFLVKFNVKWTTSNPAVSQRINQQIQSARVRSMGYNTQVEIVQKMGGFDTELIAYRDGKEPIGNGNIFKIFVVVFTWIGLSSIPHIVLLCRCKIKEIAITKEIVN